MANTLNEMLAPEVGAIRITPKGATGPVTLDAMVEDIRTGDTLSEGQHQVLSQMIWRINSEFGKAFDGTSNPNERDILNIITPLLERFVPILNKCREQTSILVKGAVVAQTPSEIISDTLIPEFNSLNNNEVSNAIRDA